MELELLGVRPVEPDEASRRWRGHLDGLALAVLLREALVAHVAAVLAIIAVVALVAGEPAR